MSLASVNCRTHSNVTCVSQLHTAEHTQMSFASVNYTLQNTLKCHLRQSITHCRTHFNVTCVSQLHTAEHTQMPLASVNYTLQNTLKCHLHQPITHCRTHSNVTCVSQLHTAEYTQMSLASVNYTLTLSPCCQYLYKCIIEINKEESILAHQRLLFLITPVPAFLNPAHPITNPLLTSPS